MPGFGFSKSKNKSKTNVDQNTQSNSGMNYDTGSNYGSGNQYGGGSNYQNQGGGSYGSNMFGAPQFNQMYGNLNNMWGGFQGPGGAMGNINQAAGQAGQFNQDVANSGKSAYENLMAGGQAGAAGAAMSPGLQESLSNSMSGPSQTGQMYQNIVGGEGNTYIDPLIDQMRGDENTRQNRNASQITGGAAGAGQSGSSRHGIAEGLMRSEGNRGLASNEAAARAGAYDTDLNWKMDIANRADAGIGNAQDRAIGLMNSGDRNTQAGLNQGQNMQNMGMGMMGPQMQAGMMPFQMAGMYSNAMGGPQQMNYGNQYDQGYGSNNMYGGGNQYGNSYGQGGSFEDYMNQYNMQNKSSGSSMGVSASMGA